MHTLSCGSHTFIFNGDLSGDIQIYTLFPETDYQNYFPITWEELCIIMDLYKTNNHHDIREEDYQTYIEEMRFKWKISDTFYMCTENKFIFRQDVLHLFKKDDDDSIYDFSLRCDILMEDIISFVISNVKTQAIDKIEQMEDEMILATLVIRGDKITFPID